MTRESAEITAARRFAKETASMLQHTPSFQQLDATTRSALMRDLGTIAYALTENGGDPYVAAQQAYRERAVQPRTPTASARRPAMAVSTSSGDPYALALETPLDLRRRRGMIEPTNQPPETPPQGENDDAAKTGNGAAPTPRAATDTIAARAGALSDEIDFPAFVAGLVHGTFDAMVDASIRQMEAFAELVSAVAKDVDRFTSENVTTNQVRDWLVQQYPRDLVMDFPAGGLPQVRRRQPSATQDGEPVSPVWLADYGLEGEELTDELIEETLVPLARRRVGENRLQTLATMVLMGMNRIVIKDGTIAAKLRFRAIAMDKAAVDLAISQDPVGGSNWGNRGSAAQGKSAMMVSTVGVNVQAESELRAELFGEVRINFASETLPLERFVDSAQMTLLQRHSRSAANNSPPALPAPPPTPSAPPPPTSSTPPPISPNPAVGGEAK